MAVFSSSSFTNLEKGGLDFCWKGFILPLAMWERHLQQLTQTSGHLPFVVVVVLGFNNRLHLPCALDSILRQTYPCFRVLFVDNGSTDGSAEFVSQHYPQVTVLANETNVGYAGAVHQTLSQVFAGGADAALVVNADVVLDPHCLEELVAAAYRDEAIGSAQPKILLFPPGSKLVNTLGNEINFLGFGFCGHFREEDSERFNDDREIVFPSGACVLVKSAVYRDVGGFDPDFFCYLEDQDFGWRSRMYGWHSILAAKARIWHDYRFLPEGAKQRKLFLYERNRWLFLLKNFGGPLLVLILPMLVVVECGILVHSIFFGYFRAKLSSYVSVIRNLRQLWKKRRYVQRGRRVPDRALVGLLSPVLRFEGFDNLLLKAANTVFARYFRLVKGCYRLCSDL